MHTKRKCIPKFKLNDILSKEIERKFYVDESALQKKSIYYDMIICLDLMSELGMLINFWKKVIDWEYIQISITTNKTRFSDGKQLKALLLSSEEPTTT